MALFIPSTRTVSGTCIEIADCAGASADTDMTTRALRSLNAAIKYYNARIKWDFLAAEANPVNVVAPFSVGGVSASAGQSSAACPVNHGLQPDDFLSGSGISVGTRVVTTATASFIVNDPFSFGAGVQSFTASAGRDLYDLPSDFKTAYSVRTLVGQRALRQARQRHIDRAIINEFETSTPLYYDLFTVGSKGKLRLVPAPNAADVLLIRYHRRMTTYTTSATATTLDMPLDYDEYMVAYAKWHFLTDKSEGRTGQAATWLAVSNEGVRTMLADQTAQPDEDLVIRPGHTWVGSGPNSTWDDWT
jgi:hypothetical protein